MGVFGINMNEFEGKTPGGWTPPDPGRQTFEITGISEGVNSKGDHAGERYITAKCVLQSGDDPGTKVHSQYLGLSDKPGKYGRPIEQTVGYLKAWGRYDLLEAGEDADTQNVIGTIFRGRRQDQDARGWRATGESHKYRADLPRAASSPNTRTSTSGPGRASADTSCTNTATFNATDNHAAR